MQLLGLRYRSITEVVRGARFYDAVPHNGDALLRVRAMLPGMMLEARIAWASSGPELKDTRLCSIDPQRALNPQMDYVRGKRIAHALTDGADLVIAFDDGHDLRIKAEGRRDPEGAAVDVRVLLPPALMTGTAQKI